MKSIADLKKLRDQAKSMVEMRDANKEYRVVVGMATCGIAAGAKPVLNALVEEAANAKVTNANITQTGCIGMCTLEPIVEIYNREGKKTTYVKVTPETAVEILHSHVMEGKVLEEYTIANYKK
ncbi:MAG: (2Fe-2S) ferredoxin domain-containing protein [Erysipelotrichales bacterium]|nr:(2Fe-2S) ferredoxin domain-containing protein [Erysipelotrichales bacterium]